MNATFTMKKPDDWHLHLREGEAAYAALPHTVRQFGRAIVMPNLTPPVTTGAMAMNYKERIDAMVLSQSFPAGSFEPLMTIYLTDNTSPEDVVMASESGVVVAAKLYPANATTNSASGVTDIHKLTPVFQKMADVGLVLCVHGETLVSKVFGDATRSGRVGQLRREAVFLKESLEWIVKNFPTLKIVLEHITTAEAVDFVKRAPANVAATITAHHLLETLDAVFESHHNKCMPTLKEEPHRQALLGAATSGNPKFFAGTDSAPHAKSKKETACGCAGCFTAPHAVELYATAFEEREAIDCLEGFMSFFGADFYDLPRNTDIITVKRETWTIPEDFQYGENEVIVPFWARKSLQWKVA